MISRWLYCSSCAFSSAAGIGGSRSAADVGIADVGIPDVGIPAGGDVAGVDAGGVDAGGAGSVVVGDVDVGKAGSEGPGPGTKEHPPNAMPEATATAAAAARNNHSRS